jgi:hypothetical protein
MQDRHTREGRQAVGTATFPLMDPIMILMCMGPECLCRGERVQENSAGQKET